MKLRSNARYLYAVFILGCFHPSCLRSCGLHSFRFKRSVSSDDTDATDKHRDASDESISHILEAERSRFFRSRSKRRLEVGVAFDHVLPDDKSVVVTGGTLKHLSKPSSLGLLRQFFTFQTCDIAQAMSVGSLPTLGIDVVRRYFCRFF